MTKPNETDAMDHIRAKFGNYPGFDEGVKKAYADFMIGQIVYDAREEAGLTIRELAEMAGTTESALSELEEADYQGDSLALLHKVAAALQKQIEIRLIPIASSE